jgi:hypothetical protein
VQRHLVVFDCNIYLDVASLLGPPFEWSKFDAAVAKLASVEVPHPKDRAYDSLRALAVCTSGRFVRDELLEVWTSGHIDAMVRGKASQPVIADSRTGHRGLGWPGEAARALVDDLVHGLVGRSGGDALAGHVPGGNPPLDHEDGMVFGACRRLAGEDPLAEVYCVTRDRGFLDAYRSGGLGRHSRVLAPSEFVALIRAVRLHYSMTNMIRKRTD